MHAVVTCSLSKSYGAHEALRGVDLRVPAGSLYGFPGPEGAGEPTGGSHYPNSLLTHQLVLT
jgi:ABC-type multidrug transport system ATPase subunit